MSHIAIVVPAGLGAALAFAGSSALKHVSAGDVPAATTLTGGRLVRLVRATVTHRLWLAGIVCDVLGVGLQLVALHFGPLALVQPLLTSGLLFALLLRRLHDRHVAGRFHVGWAVVLALSLGGFVTLVAGRLGAPQPVDRVPAIIIATVSAAFAGAFVWLGRREPSGSRSAALLGLALGVIYAGTAALLKAVTNAATPTWWHVFTAWQLYGAIVLGASALLLNQLAFQAGPLVASLPAAATVDPLLSIVIGMFVYDERIRRGPVGSAVLIVLVILLGLSVIRLAIDSASAQPKDPAAADDPRAA